MKPVSARDKEEIVDRSARSDDSLRASRARVQERARVPRFQFAEKTLGGLCEVCCEWRVSFHYDTTIAVGAHTYRDVELAGEKFSGLVGEGFQELLASFGKRKSPSIDRTSERACQNWQEAPENLSQPTHRISLRLPRCEVLLLADGVRFREPFAEFVVDVGGAHESEIVDVVSRRECLNRSKSQIVEAARQHEMPIEPILPRRDLRERHSHVKCDSRFFRKNDYGSDTVDGIEKYVEQKSNSG